MQSSINLAGRQTRDNLPFQDGPCMCPEECVNRYDPCPDRVSS